MLQRANKKSIDFEANYGKRHKMTTKDKHVSAQSDDEFCVIRDLFRIVKAWSRPEDQAACISMLQELQKRAKVKAVAG